MIMFHLINVDINQSKRMVLWVSLFPILVHISLMFSLLQSFGQAFRTSTSSAATASLPSTQKLTMSSTSSPSSLSLADRIRGSLFGLYVADATAMPVHWMYNLYQLQRDYGTITGYVKPKDQFEGSIMNLSNTGGGGRGSDQGDIIGSVINHGKKKYWGRGGNFHYHLGLDAGDNTLEAQLCRLLTRNMIKQGGYQHQAFLQEYVQFMTTPGSHNDTYASTCHRMFFANYIRKVPLEQCADNDGHNTDAIDALTLTVPVILHYHGVYSAENANYDRTPLYAKVNEVIAATRKTKALKSYAESFSNIMIDVLQGGDLRETIEKYTGKSIRTQVERSRQDPMVACYIDSSYPALLFFAYKYADSPEAAILANANAGGENVARGSLLGALMGAKHGLPSFPAWAHGLKQKDAIMHEIDGFVQASVPTASPTSSDL